MRVISRGVNTLTGCPVMPSPRLTCSVDPSIKQDIVRTHYLTGIPTGFLRMVESFLR